MSQQKFMKIKHDHVFNRKDVVYIRNVFLVSIATFFRRPNYFDTLQACRNQVKC